MFVNFKNVHDFAKNVDIFKTCSGNKQNVHDSEIFHIFKNYEFEKKIMNSEISHGVFKNVTNIKRCSRISDIVPKFNDFRNMFLYLFRKLLELEKYSQFHKTVHRL